MSTNEVKVRSPSCLTFREAFLNEMLPTSLFVQTTYANEVGLSQLGVKLSEVPAIKTQTNSHLSDSQLSRSPIQSVKASKVNNALVQIDVIGAHTLDR
jgi:hypothetical protein